MHVFSSFSFILWRLQYRQLKAQIFKTLLAREGFYFHNMINPGYGSTIFLISATFEQWLACMHALLRTAHALPFDVSISVAHFNGILLHWWRVIHLKHLFLQPFMTLLIFGFTISFYQFSYCKCHASETNFSFLFIFVFNLIKFYLPRLFFLSTVWKGIFFMGCG